MPRRMPDARPRAVVAALGAAAIGVLLAACAQPLIVDPAPYAGDPACAPVMLAMPETLGGLTPHSTSSQATTAYGAEFPIIARCGVEPPGPTTAPCVAIASDAGNQDWLVVDQGDLWRATAFGRTPALELTIPKVRADKAVGDVLAEVSGPASLAPSNGLACR